MNDETGTTPTALCFEKYVATVICSTILAIVAIIFGFKNHRAGAAMTPMSVIGLSAATITIVGSLNILTSQAIIRTMFPY